MSDPFSFLVPRRAFALGGASLALAACGAKPLLAPKPRVLTIDVLAAASLNPSASGRPSPVVVRIYELKAAAPFESADFVMLFDKDQATLGGDVVARDEFVLGPRESTAIRRDLTADSKFIAVMAAFRDLERAKWRAVVPVVAGQDNALSVRLETSTVSIVRRS
ncbi:MAG TPA: type VI secretion system lipoprotein TssJ [Variovorax sp.]|nr:type VI secretion system lipoprotein TssJ [Variovorax sp.]